MSLRDELDALRKKNAASRPPVVSAILKKAIHHLSHSGLVENTLRKGDHTPAFALPNGNGQSIRSEEALARGPLVLSFYRGKW